jgi:acetyl esterase/lipase
MSLGLDVGNAVRAVAARRIPRGAVRSFAVLLVVVLAVGACVPAPGAPAPGAPAPGAPAGPPPGTDGAPGSGPGSAGPCGVARRELPNPADARYPIALVEPTGRARPVTGGRCDDRARPVVLVAHGYLGVSVDAYGALVEHLVSNGHVVAFPTWPIEFDPPHQYRVVDTGVRVAVEASGRADTSRLGVVGHSFGGGMSPWLAQQAAARGWGGTALWAVLFAPWFALQLPEGGIDLPRHARVAVVHYTDDYVLDARIGIELFDSLDLPLRHRVHLTARSDDRGSPPVSADHLGPVAFTVPWLGALSTDVLDRWAWRVLDATAMCSLAGRWCGTDLGEVGTWPDGRAVRRAVVSRDPVDSGPVSFQECDFLLNPRPCP